MKKVVLKIFVPDSFEIGECDKCPLSTVRGASGNGKNTHIIVTVQNADSALIKQLAHWKSMKIRVTQEKSKEKQNETN